MVRLKNNLIYNLAEPESQALDLDFYTPLLESSFKAAGFHDTFLISDILMALNLFSQKSPLDTTGIEGLLIRILVDNGLLDVADYLKQALGTPVQPIDKRIAKIIAEMKEMLPKDLHLRIEDRLNLAGYQSDDLSESFLKVLCHEEVRIWQQSGAPYQVENKILLPNQDLRHSLSVNSKDVNWSWDELKVYFGGTLYKSLRIEIDCEAIQQRLGGPVMEMVFLKVFNELLIEGVGYIQRRLNNFESEGGECDYISIRMSFKEAAFRKTMNNESFSSELELSLRDKFVSLGKKRSLFFHLDT